MEGTLDLVARAQNGDDLATTELFNIIREYHLPRYVGRYFGKNVVVSNEEIESEFLLGVWKAMPKAKLDVGNPVNFMCWRGQKAVQSLMRSNIRRETRFECLECGQTGIMGYRARVPVCTMCGTPDVYTWMVEDAEPEGFDIWSVSTGVSAETAWQLAVYGIQIEEIRGLLSGRTLELFDILILEGINRDSSTNYLREISERWGTSKVRVVQCLRKLRRAIESYIEAEGR